MNETTTFMTISKSASKTLTLFRSLLTQYNELLDKDPKKAFSLLRQFAVHGSKAIIKDARLCDVLEGFVSMEERKKEKTTVAKEFKVFKATYNLSGNTRNDFRTTLDLKHANSDNSEISLDKIFKVWEANDFKRMTYLQFLTEIAK